jgi:ankyrin repeat protein
VSKGLWQEKGGAMNKQEKLNRRLEQAAQLGAVDALAGALEDGADARSGDSSALSFAAERGHAQCVRALIPVSDPVAKKSRALVVAAAGGHAECVRILIPVSEPKAGDSDALQWAANEGHVECVRLLIPVSEPKAGDSLALRFAAQEGHAECVRMLLPVSDPVARRVQGLDGSDPVELEGYGLKAADSARENGHMEVAGMIEAFIESQNLSNFTQHAKPGPRGKSSL